jgi:osmotically-inducible protein OsmY
VVTILVCAAVSILPGRLAAEDPTLVDLRLTVLARKTLAEDRDLGPLNIAVRVRDRVATLLGPVPSADLGQRAAARLARLPELVGVRNELFVDSDSDAIHLRPRTSHPPAKATRAASTGVLLKVPSAAGAAPKPPARTTASTGNVPPAASRSVPVPPATAPAPTTIEPAVRRLLQGDERYRRLHAQVRDGKVYLSGSVYRWEDVHELARLIGRIPGVDRIVLHQIEADPNGR